VRNPGASLTEEQVIEVLTRLLKIHKGQAPNDNQAVIARDFGVDKKTINRIKNGTTWNYLHQRFFTQVVPLVSALQKLGDFEELSEEEYALMGFLAHAKSLYCLDHDKPMFYGSYDWIDGEHVVVSDGMITWEQENLYQLALRARDSGFAGPPIFADTTEEMPTFALSEIMTKPVGCRFHSVEDLQGLWHFTSETGEDIYLTDKYVKMFHRLKGDWPALEIRQAGQQLDFVYLTKIGKDSDDITVCAAIATLEIT
jgi:hypothetical protein